MDGKTNGAVQTLEEEKLVATGNAGLDNILGGGLTPNRLYLLEGDPGAGKTTLALEFLLEGVKHGEQGLYVTLSETKNELIAMAKSHHWSLEKIHIFELMPSKEKLRPESQYTVFHPSEVELSETTKLILKQVEEINPARIVFDSLSELRLLAQNPLRFRRQILALKQFFVDRECTLLMLDDRTSDASSQLYSIAHGVIALERLSPQYGAERRRLEIKKMRGKPYRGGLHDFVIRSGGLDVFPRLVAAEHHKETPDELFQSGLKEIDALLGGGLDRGTSTLIMGPAGVGKSTICTQFAIAAAARGEHCAFYAFDENTNTLMKRSKGMGLPLQAMVDKGLINVEHVDPAEVSPGEFAARVRRAVEKDNARIVIIDSLNGYLNAMPTENFLTIQLHELLSYLAQMGVSTFIILAQHGLIGTSIQSAVDASYLADGVLLLRYFEASGRVRKAIAVLKKRSGGHEDTIREFRVTSKGIEVSEPLNEFRGILTGVPLMDRNGKEVENLLQ